MFRQVAKLLHWPIPNIIFPTCGLPFKLRNAASPLPSNLPAMLMELCASRKIPLYYAENEFFIAWQEAAKIGAELVLGDEPYLLSIFKQVLLMPEERISIKTFCTPSHMDPIGCELVEFVRKSFPRYIKIVIKDRNKVTVRKLKDVLQRHKIVLAVKGMLHVSGMKKLLLEEGIAAH